VSVAVVLEPFSCRDELLFESAFFIVTNAALVFHSNSFESNERKLGTRHVLSTMSRLVGVGTVHACGILNGRNPLVRTKSVLKKHTGETEDTGRHSYRLRCLQAHCS
jgi:hypothetical protein